MSSNPFKDIQRKKYAIAYLIVAITWLGKVGEDIWQLMTSIFGFHYIFVPCQQQNNLTNVKQLDTALMFWFVWAFIADTITAKRELIANYVCSGNSFSTRALGDIL